MSILSMAAGALEAVHVLGLRQEAPVERLILFVLLTQVVCDRGLGRVNATRRQADESRRLGQSIGNYCL